MKFGRWACAGLLLVAFAAASVLAQQDVDEFELDVIGTAGRQLLREAEPYDDKKVRCRKNYKGKKVCVATCYKKHCHKKGKKVYCSKAKVSCKKPTAKKPTYKKATPKKVEDHPHPEDHHGAGHTRKLQSADQETEYEVTEPETGRQLLREAEPYDDKKVYCHKSKGKKVCRAECHKKVCYRSKWSKKKSCSMKKCSCKDGHLIEDKPKKATKPYKKATKPYKPATKAPVYKTHAPTHDAYDDHGGKKEGGSHH